MDIAVAYNKYAFLGSEFLAWLWWASEKDEEAIDDAVRKEESTIITLGNGMTIENDGQGVKAKSKITIKGADAGHKEAIIAMSEGGQIKEINLHCTIGDMEFSFTITSDDLSLKGLKTPTIGESKAQDEIEGAVLEKLSLDRVVFEVLDDLFNYFIDCRLSDNWKDTTLPAMREWLKEGGQLWNASCDASIADYEGPDVCNSKITKARNAHKCTECGQPIDLGTEYEYVTGRWDGDDHTYKTCSDCLSLRRQFFSRGYYYEMLWENFWEYVDGIGAEIPESCIAVLPPGARAKVCEMIEDWWDKDECPPPPYLLLYNDKG